MERGARRQRCGSGRGARLGAARVVIRGARAPGHQPGGRGDRARPRWLADRRPSQARRERRGATQLRGPARRRRRVSRAVPVERLQALRIPAHEARRNKVPRPRLARAELVPRRLLLRAVAPGPDRDQGRGRARRARSLGRSRDPRPKERFHAHQASRGSDRRL